MRMPAVVEIAVAVRNTFLVFGARSTKRASNWTRRQHAIELGKHV